MARFITYLKHYIPQVIAIVVLLIVQAYCNLSLPAYTSDIVDVGIQQGGISDAAAMQLSDDTLRQLELFMNDEEIRTVEDGYEKNGDGIWELTAKGSSREKVSDALTMPMVLLYQAGQSGKYDLEKAEQAAAAGLIGREQLLEMRAKAEEAMGDTGTMFTQGVAVEFVKGEYQKLGIDLNRVQKDYLYAVGLKMMGMTLIMVLASVAAGYLSSYVSAKNSETLRQQMFEKVLSLDSEKIEQFSTASLITRCTNDIQQVQMTMVMLLRIVLYAPILAVGGIVRVIGTTTGMSWIIVVAALVISGLVLGLVAMTMPKFKMMQKKVDRVNLVSREILTGIPVIRAFGREKAEEERFDTANKELMQTQLFTNRVMNFMMPLMMFLMNIVSVAIIWFGGKGVDAGNMQIGDMIAFMTYAMEIIMAFMMIEMISVMLPRASVAAGRVDEVLAARAAITDKADTKEADAKAGRGELVFDHVTFTYPGAEEPVLKDISFTAEPGKTTAFIGSTGCGKSTLLQLIPRFYDVTEGRVTIDGADIREMSQKRLRDMIGLVPQKGVLFSGTIESNLKFGGSSVTDEAMKEAAGIAQAEEFICQKPEGYESPIAQGGTNVSGGQKQRLSIARAIAKHPRIYLFDDSFSALDYKTDAVLRRELNQKITDATILIVAQRISTVLHADQIIVLDEGEIKGIGTHEALLKTCAAYREIAKSQLSEKELGIEEGEAE